MKQAKYRIANQAIITGHISYGTGTFTLDEVTKQVKWLNESDNNKWCHFWYEPIPKEKSNEA